MAQICVAVNTFALVDDNHWSEVISTAHTWHLNSNGYARANIGNKKLMYLHTLIYSFIDPIYKGEVDHWDRDRLNCQSYNLRRATDLQNSQNKGRQSNNTSGCPGVHEILETGRWRASIWINEKRKHLGVFETLEEAAEVRRAAELYYYGAFAP